MARVEQPVDEAAVGSLDRDRQVSWRSVVGEPAHETLSEHRSSLVWQHELGDGDGSRAVTDWRSAERPSVAGPLSPGGPGAAVSG
jgi:hypothetical protein